MLVREGRERMYNMIEFGKAKYDVHRGRDGRVSIKRFNPRSKMWVQINFEKEPTNNARQIEKFITETLANQVLERFTVGQ